MFTNVRIKGVNYETLYDAVKATPAASRDDPAHSGKCVFLVRPVKATFELNLGIINYTTAIQPRPAPLVV